jgi:hypothetical protein
MRRRTLLVVLAGLAVVGAAGVVLWPRPRLRITRENLERIKEGYDRIERGMTLSEVVDILGPPGDYRTGPSADFFVNVDPFGQRPDVLEFRIWMSDTLFIGVWVEDDGHILGVYEFLPSPSDQSHLDNFLWRLKRQWHRWFPE